MREREQKGKVKGASQIVPSLPSPTPMEGRGHKWDRMPQSLHCLHSAFLGTWPILVWMFRRRKKAPVLAAQITSATQKAVLQL